MPEWATEFNAAGSIACWAAGRLAQLQNRGFVLRVESDDVVVTTSKQVRHIHGATVAQANPNELWWRTRSNANR